ncbi:MBL fold metallo-hydrolase [Cellulomonas chitinilytica]|uniref:MBL fold metallo-hydrolase n=1 Tax=Cellulomonas chitinilytica TaxID=398759 RepID=A0A919TZ00_9CELL|nr:MBL fold metallo-hydrolase [Cellulomonas chitinilytica]GIG20303.1 MBL fold metallo-hydrolase [Cellulomonas chitinilytica]
MTRLTRWGHSCVRLDRDSSTLVIDPGVFSSLDGALAGTRAVLVTHEHADHVDVARIAAATQEEVDVWGPQAVVDALAGAGAAPERLHAVRAGDTVDAGGFEVRVLGEWHALIHADIPRIANVGYLVENVLHPGDAFVDPEGAPVDVLLAPLGAPWLKLGEVVDYIRAVKPRQVVAVHDVLLSDPGRGLSVLQLGRLGGAGELVVLEPGDGIDL